MHRTDSRFMKIVFVPLRGNQRQLFTASQKLRFSSVFPPLAFGMASAGLSKSKRFQPPRRKSWYTDGPLQGGCRCSGHHSDTDVSIWQAPQTRCVNKKTTFRLERSVKRCMRRCVNWCVNRCMNCSPRCMSRCMDFCSPRWPYSNRLKAVENSGEKIHALFMHLFTHLGKQKSMHLFMHLGNKNSCTYSCTLSRTFSYTFLRTVSIEKSFFINTPGLRSLKA